jgi:putative flippase GtrA
MLSKFLSYIRDHRWQLMRFFIVGIATFALNFSMVWLFYGKVGIDYRIAVTYAYLITIVAHFFLNRSFTYRQNGCAVLPDTAKYCVMLVFNYMITLVVTTITVELLLLTPYYSTIFSTLSTALSSFILMKHFVFIQKGNSVIPAHFLVFAKFGMIGAATTVIYFFVMWGVDSILNLNYTIMLNASDIFQNHRIFDSIPNFKYVVTINIVDMISRWETINSIPRLKYVAIVSIAYFVSTTFHYLANRHFTFGATDGRHRHQIVRYMVMWSINYMITMAVVGICVERFQLSAYVGVCISVAFTWFVGYFLARNWVFKV